MRQEVRSESSVDMTTKFIYRLGIFEIKIMAVLINCYLLDVIVEMKNCLLYTSPSPRDRG